MGAVSLMASTKPAPLYVCVYVPEFCAQALQRLRSELAGSPVVVLAGKPPLEEVCSANALAFKLGVMHGMTRAELESFPGVKVLHRSEQEERIARSVLLEAAAMFTPRIEVQITNAHGFAMVLDMTGTTRIFGQAKAMAESVLRAMSALHFFSKLAVSANLKAAVCLAAEAHTAPIIVPKGQERDYLSKLHLSTLEITEQQMEMFELWGLRTLGELAALPEIELVVRLGQEGKRLRLLACGELQHHMVPEEPAFSLEEMIVFDSPVEMMDSLLFVLGPMLDQLFTRAQSRAFALASVTLKLGLDGGVQYERNIKPALPVRQRDVLLKLLHLDLQAHPPSAGVLSIFLHAEPGDRSKVQLGLFAPQLPEALRLDVTLARIAALVGEERVGRAKLQDAHRPDSFAMERFSVVDGNSRSSAGKPKAVALRRCRPPLFVSAQHEGGRLAAFVLKGKRYVVQQAYGPWRKSGAWWRAEAWSCEEWDVHALHAGEHILCLILHDLLRRQWQVDALYD